MVRSKKSQTAHDKKVQQLAKKLEEQGFEIKADIKGYEKPKTLGGFRPDIIAKKGNQRKIIEVETPDSKDSARDKGQQQAFKQAAKRSSSTTFHREITE